MNDPIRVLHVFNAMNIGGAESIVMTIYRNIDRTKIQFDFLVHTQEKADFDDEISELGGQIYRVKRPVTGNFYTYVRDIKKLLKAHKEIAVVHGHMGSTAAIYLATAKKCGRVTIAHCHSANKSNVLFNILSYPTRYIADHLFACSEKAGMARYGKRVWQQRKGIIIQNGIESGKYIFDEKIRKRYRMEFGIADKFVIGHVGRLSYPKNHQYLLQIFSEYKKIRNDAMLLLVGTGELADELLALAERLKITDSVIFAGMRKDVPECLMAMDIFVFPSIYEGLPISVIEAQATGLNCIISENVTKEVAISDKVSFKSIDADPKEWAAAIAEHTNEYNRNGMKEMIDNAGYNIVKTCETLQKFYTEILQKQRKENG